MDLKEKIIYHSDKFKKLIESQSGSTPLETEDWGWENYRYVGDRFRLAHVERYFLDGMLILHITCFPNQNYKSPVFGFDVVCAERTGKMSGAFLDLSPILFDKPFHNIQWSNARKLPYWATVFSKEFIAIRPTEDEHDKLFESAYEIFQNFLNELNSDIYRTDEVSEIEDIINKQNEYCEYQAKNERTFAALKHHIGEERAKYFMTQILFPKIETESNTYRK